MSDSISDPYENEDLPEFTVQTQVKPNLVSKRSTPPVKNMMDYKKPFWVKPGEAIEIQGAVLKDGMVYVGEVPRSSASAQTEYGPELINLALDIAPMGQFTMRQTGYWPSYDALAPSGRRAYLHWLSEGRRHKDADPGLVFLFFYGLERRVLTSPLPLTQAREAEWERIAQELKALLAIYAPRSPSFEGYAQRLLAWMSDFRTATDEILWEKALSPFLVPADLPPAEQPKKWLEIWEKIQKTYPYPRARHSEMPWRLRLTLGQMSRDNLPLSPPMALAWLHYHPDITLRTPAVRCPEQFDTLFMYEFAQKFPQWIRLLKSRTPLRKEYSPASHALQFHPGLKMAFSDIPDITPLKQGLNKLEEIALYVCEQLDLYSRALSKEPADPQGMDLQILLPFMLWPSGMRRKIQDLAAEIKANGTKTASFFQIFQFLNPQPEKTPDLPKKLSLKQIQILLENLKKHQVGVEPQPRKNSIDLSETYAFFHHDFQPEEMLSDLRPAVVFFLQASVFLALCEKQKLAPPKRHFIEKQLLSAFPEMQENPLLFAQSKAHLNALGGLSENKIFTLAKKKLSDFKMTENGQISLLNQLIRQAGFSGMISLGGMKALEKLYPLLGRNVTHLPNDVSRGFIEALTLEKTQNHDGQGTLSLDLAQIEAKRKDTQDVSLLLETIFNPEEAPQKPDTPPPSPKSESASEKLDEKTLFPNLDKAHQEMAKLLLTKPVWERAEIEAIAQKLNLMAEGALENMNEAAFDLYDEPFTEGEDPFEINPEILDRI